MVDSKGNKGGCIALIPARSGSKSIADKNLVDLGGYPLIAYSIVAARCCPLIDEVVVSTDSEVYAEVARRYGAIVPFLRPDAISGDASLDEDFFRHYYGWLKNEGVSIPDLVVHLRPTTPFRRLDHLNGAIDLVKNNRDLSSVRSMARSELTPFKMFMNADGLATPFMSHSEAEFYNMPRQSFPSTYIPNGVVDVLRPSVLLESGLLHGERMAIWETEWVPDIDSLDDLVQASEFASRDGDFSYLYEALESCR